MSITRIDLDGMRYPSSSMKTLFIANSFLNMLIINMILCLSAIAQPDLGSSQTVLVQQGDSLFRIALENRPDQTVSIQQTMVAIQQLNPNSFLGGNINRVKAGERLLLPDINQISRISLDEAIREIRDQNQDISDLSSTNMIDEAGSGQLSVLVPGAEVSAGLPELAPLEQENAELDLRISQLENLIALNLEEEDRARLRREELVQRLTELNTEITDMKELVRLQDLQLGQLRAQLAEVDTQVSIPEILTSDNIPTETDNPQESQSFLKQAGGNLVGFFQSNSPLVTIAAPLALFLLGWLLWWDRANYAESEALSDKSVGTDPQEDRISGESNRNIGVRYDSQGVSPERVQIVRPGEVAGGVNNREETLSQGADDAEIEFIADPSGDDSFGDLEFLSDEERERLDSPDAIEEIFYLGDDEESATKLELAYAYQKMGDFEGAKEILLEVSDEGNSEQKREADELLKKIESPNIHN